MSARWWLCARKPALAPAMQQQKAAMEGDDATASSTAATPTNAAAAVPGGGNRAGGESFTSLAEESGVGWGYSRVVAPCRGAAAHQRCDRSPLQEYAPSPHA
eukprot:6637589-Pyramimonas_sp.AAC.1